ncbi:hypothetical protein C1X27_25090 [Pseudomonas sp. MPR-AND1B]|uniref:Uncharacterized protein n=1 Tax=Pseudomonas fluorescens TaxID=294 RepID=A0A2T0IIT4_PSEFL|nr:hypothetical protein [Pseudomonas sp. B2021]PMY76171.1 hypothetical protein C1X26_06020 [Pseudomonas sp. MPR-R3A]PMY99972.1 hypothetical protein C1X24_02800 [Pseudomonas sp. FW305-124]PMZ75812.1 hypothetical protein C1X25_02655 [Pseudomonas sp. GW247-3R2A]PNA93553.1 hypothetical protein C1X23_11345 [Pseudomonas sp. FW300-E2]PNA96631.1 hypothetical protein C1X27_25090 [Pseudomonas sp. MPR-AND1B]PNY75600.1 hypothetical protein C1751_14665 [Pseudomonas fluorescens]PTT12317.1 hypothetical pro
MQHGEAPTKIVPTLCVGMHPVTLCVTTLKADAERPGRHSHAERGNDQVRQKSLHKRRAS